MCGKAQLKTAGATAMKRDKTNNNQVCVRSNRMFRQDGQWYFRTREESVIGPFRDELEASTQLEVYIRLLDSQLLPARDESSSEHVARKRTA
ncbi:MAG: DUF6316 family protein [Halioglobus sp.]